MKPLDLRSGEEYRLSASAKHTKGSRRARLHRILARGFEFQYLDETTGEPIVLADGTPATILMKTARRVEGSWADITRAMARARREEEVKQEIEKEIRAILAEAGMPTTPKVKPGYMHRYEPSVWVGVDSTDAMNVTGIAIACYEPQGIAQLWALLRRAALKEEADA